VVLDQEALVLTVVSLAYDDLLRDREGQIQPFLFFHSNTDQLIKVRQNVTLTQARFWLKVVKTAVTQNMSTGKNLMKNKLLMVSKKDLLKEALTILIAEYSLETVKDTLHKLERAIKDPLPIVELNEKSKRSLAYTLKKN
jgi:hypothetical protein